MKESCMCSSVVPVLQYHLKNLKQQNEILLQSVKKINSKSLCLRITGIPSQKNESAEDVRNSVKSIIEKSGCNIPDIALDRTYIIGKNDPLEKIVIPVILRLTTFRHRTMFYPARKSLSKNELHLDLTKERFTLYQKTRDLVKSNKLLDLKLSSKITRNHFPSIKKLLVLTDQENNPGVLGYGAEGANS